MKQFSIGKIDFKTWCEQNGRMELLLEWNNNKNAPLSPEFVAAGSSKKVWWIGSCGHNWEATIHNRVKGSNCPYCANKKVLPGFNDLATLRPEFVKEWNYEKNQHLVDGLNVDISTPDKVTVVSGNKVWWKCSNGHEWQAAISHRTSRGDGCPYCYGRYVITGVNDLMTLFPEVAQEWNYERNTPLKPNEVTSKSEKKVWWICSKGHEWQTTISHRTSDGNGCPFCSGRYPIRGVNDFATLFPELLNEWDYDKNGDLLPYDVTAKSERRVWWKCSKGHEWRTLVAIRALGCGCPRCSGVGTSLPEQGIAYYLEKVCKVEQRTKIANKEIDVYLPEYKIGIEYDGRFYHKYSNHKKEKEKDTVLAENSVLLFRVKEADVNEYSEHIIKYIPDYMGDNYNHALKLLFNELSSITGNQNFALLNANAKEDFLNIRERMRLYYKENSIAVINPQLIKEWNYVKNGTLKPEMFTSGSGVKVWWICSEGHEWQSTINNRTRQHSGCPKCANRIRNIKRRKAVICIETGYKFASSYEAEKELGISGISSCCKGVQKTAGGFHWKFSDS